MPRRSFADVFLQPSPSVSVSPSVSSHQSQPAGEAAFSGWEGIVIARELPADLSGEAGIDYLTIMAGGSRWHRDHPDGVARSGAPIYVLSVAEGRWRDRTLERLYTTVAEQHNIACTGGRSNLLNFLIGSASYTGVTWFEVGTGSGTPASGDTALFTPYFRKQPSSYSISGNQALVNTTFLSGEANSTYTESGIYGSNPSLIASATLGSGVLFAHSLYPYSKTSSVSLGNNYYVSLN